MHEEVHCFPHVLFDLRVVADGHAWVVSGCFDKIA